MSASVTTVYVQNNGDEREWIVSVTNSGTGPCYNGKMTFTIPDGVSLVGPLVGSGPEIQVSKGAYNHANDIWYIGAVGAGETVSSPFTFRIDDITKADPVENWFDVETLFESDCPDPDDCDNEAHLLMKVGEVCTEINLSAGPSEDAEYEEGGISISIG